MKKPKPKLGYVPTPKEIKAAREAAGLTQTQAAHLIYKSLNGWQKWESGIRNMDPAFWEYWQLRVLELQVKCVCSSTPGKKH